MYNCSWGDGMEDLENEFDLNANLELAGVCSLQVKAKHFSI